MIDHSIPPGEVRYTQLIPSSHHGQTYYVTVRCYDGGSPSLSATTTVALTYLQGDVTTQAPPTSGEDVWETDAFLALFLTLMALCGLGEELTLRKIAIFFEKMSSFRQFFDSQLAIFRRVR